jgi:hypothetical protein
LRVVTAYEMSAPERNSYLLWRAQQNEAQDDEYPQEYGVTEENDDDAQ